MSLAAARALMMEQGIRDRRAIEAEYDDLETQKQQQESDAGWGKLIGQWGSVALGVGIAALSGGALSPLAAAVIGGVGARAGSEIGEHGGVKAALNQSNAIDKDLKLKSDTVFGHDMKTRADKNLKDKWSGFDRAQHVQGLTAAAEVYSAAGGEIPGTKAFNEAGGFETMFQNPIDAAPGTAAFGYEKGMTLGEYFTGGETGAKARLKGKGFDVKSLGDDITAIDYERKVRKGIAQGIEFDKKEDDWFYSEWDQD
tara:strand:- start:3134 stop:3898 length:765 start_codon:yes stop_codon:yes gene_type:complete